MKINAQTTSIGTKKFNFAGNADSVCPKRVAGSIPASLKPVFLQPVNTISDPESVRLMEERYGINDEGLF
jgi:hypothetical protein